MNPDEALRSIGLPPDAGLGESGYSFIEREWARPTCDINGIFGGYTGPGAKTVIPSHASAKLSFRLVGNQNHEHIAKSAREWFESKTPPGMHMGDPRSRWGRPGSLRHGFPDPPRRARAIERATSTKPSMIKSGGSIPVAGLLKSKLGLETVFMGSVSKTTGSIHPTRSSSSSVSAPARNLTPRSSKRSGLSPTIEPRGDREPSR